MPDKRKHRGRHPEDDRIFAPSAHAALRLAVDEYAWLLTRGYAELSARKLVGDHHGLTARQRMAVRRGACSDHALHGRLTKRVEPQQLTGRPLAIDGYNLLITIEAALSGGLVFIGRDGCYRDLASVHGTYRKVEETTPAVEIICAYVAGLDPAQVTVLLDRPVANSGRLRTLMAERVANFREANPVSPQWQIALADNPDADLEVFDGVVATSDSVILDRCATWINLAAHIIDDRLANTSLIDLRVPHSLPGTQPHGHRPR